MSLGNTFVLWLKLGEFRLCSVGPISDSGREKRLPLVGEPFGVLFMRSGDTCEREHQHQFAANHDRIDSSSAYLPPCCSPTCWDCRRRLPICAGEECLRRMAHAPSRRVGTSQYKCAPTRAISITITGGVK